MPMIKTAWKVNHAWIIVVLVKVAHDYIVMVTVIDG